MLSVTAITGAGAEHATWVTGYGRCTMMEVGGSECKGQAQRKGCSVASPTPRPHSQCLARGGAHRWKPRILGTPVPGVVEPVRANFMCQLDGANRGPDPAVCILRVSVRVFLDAIDTESVDGAKQIALSQGEPPPGS